MSFLDKLGKTISGTAQSQSDIEEENSAKFVYKNKVGDILLVFENYIIIKHKGALNFLAQGGLKGDKRILFNSITAVDFRKPNNWINGYIQFTIAGSNENSAGVLGAAGDENSVLVSAGDDLQKVQEIVDYIDTVRAKGNVPQAINQVQELSPADELRKYKALLEDDIITQEEFDAKKKELLGI